MLNQWASPACRACACLSGIENGYGGSEIHPAKHVREIGGAVNSCLHVASHHQLDLQAHLP